MPGYVPVRPRPQAAPRRLLRSVLGDVLRRTRRQQRRTLADVAGAARVSIAYLSELERGRKEASSEVLAAVCGALRVDLAAVLVEVGRELAHPGEAARPAVVVRLEAVRDARRPAVPAPVAPPPAPRPGDVRLSA
jgi:transcriptional regulator with XRE-family HTH domain